MSFWFSNKRIKWPLNISELLINVTIKHRHRINNRAAQVFSSTETEGLISGADGITDLSIASGCPAVSFYFKSLLLQFLFNHSDFLLEKLGIKYYPVTKPEFQLPLRSPDFFKTLLVLAFLFNHSEFFTREARDIVPPCNTARIWVEYFKNNYNWMDCQILQRSVFICWQVSLFI